VTAAYTVLLGRPVDDFDPAGEYALYYRNRARIRRRAPF
jgi:hypothetical protein